MVTERIRQLEKESARRGSACPQTAFRDTYHRAARTIFAGLPVWEKAARAMAYAVEHCEVVVCGSDTIGGRTYQTNEIPVEQMDPDLDHLTQAQRAFLEEFPDAPELQRNQLIGGTSAGHITWFFDRILTLGVSGLRRRFEEALARACDDEARQFFQGVMIMLDALLAFNDRHVEAYRAIGCEELAARMEKVPRYPAETFREAVQAFHMQHLVVMLENPYGGNGPGRLDYYLWPYLERDLQAGRCTLAQAREIIDELFLRFDERLWGRDGWVEAIVVGGTHPDGSSAVNPLSSIMVESIMDLDITHPSVYVRLPADPPQELVALCSRYMMSGRNRAQILSDPAVINALVQRGIPAGDAALYACGGCMEVGVQGMSSDFLFIGFQNTLKMLELAITGGICLRTGERVRGFQAVRGLAAYDDFESFYRDFIAEARRLTHIYLREQDIFSAYAQKARPSYLISSMIDDCLERGRNMHAGGARYHDYGGTHLALPNTADCLYAIRRAVFEAHICTAQELIDALKADFKGYEVLQRRLRAISKYGVDDADADGMALRVASDFADMYLSYRTRWDGRGKPVILTFTYAPLAASILGATADGGNAGRLVAQGVTPQSASMTEGITAAVNSSCRMPYEKFAGGASTMWDFDSAWVTGPIVEAVLRTFLAQGGQIFQGNTTPLEELLDAQKHPDEHRQLIVRVGGYSARFVSLRPELQNDIIARLRHSA